MSDIHRPKPVPKQYDELNARARSPRDARGHVRPTFAQPPLAAPVRIRDRRYIPAPRFLKRQNRFLEKGALPIGFASRPHPNGPLLASSREPPRAQISIRIDSVVERRRS